MFNAVLSLVLAFVIAQGVKSLIDIKNGRFSLNCLLETGGFPSSHTSTVAALCFVIYFEQGFSPLFLTAVVFSAIVVRDSVGVRREAGENALVLKRVTQNLNMIEKVNTAQGHRPVDVLVGAIIGVVITMLIYAL